MGEGIQGHHVAWILSSIEWDVLWVRVTQGYHVARPLSSIEWDVLWVRVIQGYHVARLLSYYYYYFGVSCARAGESENTLSDPNPTQPTHGRKKKIKQ